MAGGTVWRSGCLGPVAWPGGPSPLHHPWSQETAGNVQGGTIQCKWVQRRSRLFKGIQPWEEVSMSTANVFDVTAYILEKVGPITAMKLQKLVYYSQAWSLVWDETSLFDEPIQAWANGPVVPALFNKHQGQFKVSKESLPDGNPDNLTASEKDTIDAVLEYYGKESSQYLSDLTHMEDPWRNARAGMPDGERGNREITHAALAMYYEGLAAERATRA